MEFTAFARVQPLVLQLRALAVLRWYPPPPLGNSQCTLRVAQRHTLTTRLIDSLLRHGLLCVLQVAICQRCCWAIGGVLDRYLRYADAGDQFVGRTIALVGFLNSWKFAVLPPHFVEDVATIVEALCPVCKAFPAMVPVLTLALASVVYHATKEEDPFTFSDSHELRKSALFQDQQLMSLLKSKLNTNMYESDRMAATGIPPFVCLFMQIADIPSKVKEVFIEVLRGVNVLPRAGESGVMEAVMAQLKALDAKITAVVTPAVVSARVMIVQAMYNSKCNRFSVVPAEYVLPIKVIDAFTHWHCKTTYGDHVLPPLRTVTAGDFAPAVQRTWSEIVVTNKYLFDKLTPELQDACMAENASAQSVQAVFGRAIALNLWSVLACKTASTYANCVSHACKLLRKAMVTKKRTRKSNA